MKIIDTFLQYLDIHSETLVNVFHFLVLLFLSGVVGWLTYIVAKRWLAKLIIKVVGRTATRWDDLLFDQHFFNRFALLVTPLVIQLVLQYTGWEFQSAHFLIRGLQIWIVLSILLMLSSLMDGINRIYESYPMAKHRPIKVFIQVIKIFFYCMGLIIVISILVNKSPEALLVGLSAFAAVLMLIFKDSILGFVAGVQLIANRMVRIGDWIVMPSHGADGEVQEINLTTVKVQNWDKTISTVPTYKLVSESFTNWRGMQESGGRRIKRAVYIDIYSIHYLSDAEIEVLRQSVLLRDYIERKLTELNTYNANRGTLLDERRLTNIGTFREYMESWIASNPDINLSMTHMVRQLQPGPTGVPLEIYCFSAKQAWVDYERVQSDLFDHLFAILPLFNLKVFQYPSKVEYSEQV